MTGCFLSIAFILMFQFFYVFQQNLENSFEKGGVKRLEIKAVEATDKEDALTVADLQFLEFNPSNQIEAVTGEIARSVRVRVGPYEVPVILKGVNAQYGKFHSFQMVGRGGFFPPQEAYRARNIIVVSTKFAGRYLKSNQVVGKSLMIENLQGKSESFQIIGQFEENTLINNQRMDAKEITEMMMPVATAVRFFKTDTLDHIQINARHPSFMKSIAASTYTLLNRFTGPERSITMKTPHELIEQRQYTRSAMQKGFFILGLTLFSIGILGFWISLDFSVKGKQKEYVIRRILGATKKQLYLQVIGESVILGIIGGVIGLLIGGSILMVVGIFTGIEWIRPISSTIISMILVMLAAILASAQPAKGSYVHNLHEQIERD